MSEETYRRLNKRLNEWYNEHSMVNDLEPAEEYPQMFVEDLFDENERLKSKIEYRDYKETYNGLIEENGRLEKENERLKKNWIILKDALGQYVSMNTIHQQVYHGLYLKMKELEEELNDKFKRKI